MYYEAILGAATWTDALRKLTESQSSREGGGAFGAWVLGVKLTASHLPGPGRCYAAQLFLQPQKPLKSVVYLAISSNIFFRKQVKNYLIRGKTVHIYQLNCEDKAT